MSNSEPVEKFDFQNMDVKLYLALQAVLPLAEAEFGTLEDGNCVPEATKAATLINAARLAMCEFEAHVGPIPDWAIARNWDYSLVPGAQLCTRDGRRTGNAHIIQRVVKEVPATADRNNPYGEQTYYECLTDAGSKFTFTEQEIETAFTVGDWISDPARVLNDFDRNGEFRDEQ
jgi:hypothetical protein